jgi:choline kinase
LHGAGLLDVTSGLKKFPEMPIRMRAGLRFFLQEAVARKHPFMRNTIMPNLPQTAVILAAGMGIRLRPVVGIRPKGLLEIDGKPLLGRSIELLKAHGIRRLHVATGHQAELLEQELQPYLEGLEVKFVWNERYSESGSMHSLYQLRACVQEDFVLLESDLLYERRALDQLFAAPQRDVVLISGKTASGDEVWVYGEPPEARNAQGRIQAISKQPRPQYEAQGELTGLSRISSELYARMCAFHEAHLQFPSNYHYEECISDVCGVLAVPYLLDSKLVWTEIDTPEHYERAVGAVWPRILEADRPPGQESRRING